MSTHVVRSSGESGHEPPSHEVEAAGISVAHIVLTLRRYRRTILFWLVTIVLLYAIVAVAVYTISPGVKITSLPFRLDFDGAENNQYPNGLKFSSTDIVAANVLTRVYQSNDVAQYLSFRRFKEAIFLQESSRELEKLNLEFETRLSDGKLTPVDRERIEREYQLRRSSLRHAEYSLNFAESRLVKAVPEDVREKILRSVLNVWADLADKEKGAVKYRLPVLTTNVVIRNSVGPREYLVELDILRTRINRVLANVNALLAIPGSEIVRVGPEKISLSEIQVNLYDIRRFQIDPLITETYQKGLIRDPRTVSGYYQSQLASAQRDFDQTKAHVATLQSSLTAYMGGQQSASSAAAGIQAGNNTGGPSSGPVTPQLTEGFLDKIMKMATDSGDMKYRQDLITEANRVAITELLPAEKEVQYYQTIVQQMGAFNGISRGDLSARAADVKTVEDAENVAYASVIKALQQVSEAYLVLSRNLNPDGVLYTFSGPSITHTEKSIPLKRLVLFGVLITLLALPAIVLACLLHARVEEEEELEEEAELESLEAEGAA
ncbi:MAG: hypothetical protein JWO56_138 [Acidobacteria bacterium]|nr:hypothetical protein [Acidobacteriota bacterium]